MCGTSFTSCSVQRRNASDHVEWHSNTPIIPPQRNNRKTDKKTVKKINGDIAELVSKGQQSLTTDK